MSFRFHQTGVCQAQQTPVFLRIFRRKSGVFEHILALFLLILSAFSASAEVVTAETLAARIDRHYDTLHSLRVNFVQQYDGLGQHRRESGTLLLKKPGRMRWTYSQPAGKLFVLDGKYAYFYAPGQSEVQRVPAKKLDDLRSPLRFLLGHSEIAKELTGLKMTSQGDGYVLSGVPRNLQQRVSLLQFTVNAEGVIQGIRIEEVDGSISMFSFSDEAANSAAADSEFAFHAPPGTSIVDGPAPE